MEEQLKDIKMPKTKRGLTTFNKIVKAAEKVFGTKGYYNSMINDIAYKAKVAPGTLYIYFPDKYTLYCHLLSQYNHHIREYISSRVKDCTTRKEQERNGLLAFLEIIKERPYMYNIIWESLYIDKNLFVDYYENFAKRYIKNLDASKENGEVNNFDSMLISYVLMGISNFVGLKYVMFDENKKNSDIDLEKIADEVIEMLEKGIFK